MTKNEEKAKEISQQRCYDRNLQIAVFEDMLQIAQWKDEQFAKEKQAWIGKATEWLSNISIEDMFSKYDDFCSSEGWEAFIDDFEKVMKK